eukprot:scaffold229444_cov31-Tisochrysis_lutea.AAC.1
MAAEHLSAHESAPAWHDRLVHSRELLGARKLCQPNTISHHNGGQQCRGRSPETCRLGAAARILARTSSPTPNSVEEPVAPLACATIEAELGHG